MSRPSFVLAALAAALLVSGVSHAASYQYRQYLPGFTPINPAPPPATTVTDPTPPTPPASPTGPIYSHFFKSGVTWSYNLIGGDIANVISGGVAYCTGKNDRGACGNPAGVRYTFTAFQNNGAFTNQNIIQVCQGIRGTLLLDSNGNTWKAGEDIYGVRAATSTGDVVSIACDSYDYNSPFYFLKKDGTVWENNTKIADNARDVFAGYMNMAVLKNDGTLWVKGANNSYRLSSTAGALNATVGTLVQVATDVKSAYLAFSNTYLIKTDNTLWAVGDNTSGQLGNANAGGGVFVQTATNVTQVAASRSWSVILKTDGNLYYAGKPGWLNGAGITSVNLYALYFSGAQEVAATESNLYIITNDNYICGEGPDVYGAIGAGGNGTGYSYPADMVPKGLFFACRLKLQ